MDEWLETLTELPMNELINQSMKLEPFAFSIVDEEILQNPC